MYNDFQEHQNDAQSLKDHLQHVDKEHQTQKHFAGVNEEVIVGELHR